MSEKFILGHAQIDRLNLKEALDALVREARQARCSYVVTPNSDHLVMLESDSKFREVYQSAAITLADGMPVVWASRLLGKPLEERVTGAELLPELSKRAAEEGLKIFLLGAGPGVALEASNRLKMQFPKLDVAGVYSPPMGFEKDSAENLKIINMIKASGADIIFVGLGAPKQELWIFNNQKSFAKGLFLGVGAAIDFTANRIQRAPLWMQKSGTEWIFRLVQEPGRLAKRYAKDTYVLWIILRQLFRNKSPRN
ncbi:MAG: glycosyltransferase [Proteobacteria bacterium]|nr:MAG: glycosyltransferase [Pseudomonadota bacterium]